MSRRTWEEHNGKYCQHVSNNIIDYIQYEYCWLSYIFSPTITKLSIMWQKSLLIKCESVTANLSGWRRYIASRNNYHDMNEMKNVNDQPAISQQEKNIKNLLDDSASFNEVTDSNWASTPYPDGTAIPSDEPERPIQDPNTSSIILFPGQGTLKIGKVREYIEIPRAKEVFEIANEIMGMDLLKLCLNGPREKLDRTEFNQIATVATSIAALEKVWEERPLVIEQCKAIAGYSVGELSALIFSGALTLEDGLRLSGIRGAAMQQASDMKSQGMLLIDCFPSARPGSICEEAKKWAMDMGVSEPVCQIAIYIYTEAKIIAGDEEALKYIENNARKLAIRKTTRLSVSGAFHTRLMEPAIKSFKKALDKVVLDHPRIPTYSNVTSKPYHNPEQIKKLLLKQIVSPVKWEQIMHLIYGRVPGMNFPRTFTLGSDYSLLRILRRINLKAANSCVPI